MYRITYALFLNIPTRSKYADDNRLSGYTGDSLHTNNMRFRDILSFAESLSEGENGNTPRGEIRVLASRTKLKVVSRKLGFKFLRK